MVWVGAVAGAKILSCNRSTVLKIANRGLLANQKRHGKRFFNERELLELKLGQDLKKDLGDTVKEIFLLNEEGLRVGSLAKDYGVNRTALEGALELYGVERAHYLNGFGTNADALLTGEVMRRLRIRRKEVLYSLVNEAVLNTLEYGGHRVVSLSSFVTYLGNWSRQRVYTSREALSRIQDDGFYLTFQKLKEIAYAYDIGFKIQPNKRMSHRRFSDNDIYTLKRVC